MFKVGDTVGVREDQEKQKQKEKRTVPMVIQGRSYEGKVKRKDVIISILKNGLKNYNGNLSM